MDKLSSDAKRVPGVAPRDKQVCPRCGAKLTYVGLNNVECEGSELERSCRTGKIGYTDCENYRSSTTGYELPEIKFDTDDFIWMTTQRWIP